MYTCSSSRACGIICHTGRESLSIIEMCCYTLSLDTYCLILEGDYFYYLGEYLNSVTDRSRSANLLSSHSDLMSFTIRHTGTGNQASVPYSLAQSIVLYCATLVYSRVLLVGRAEASISWLVSSWSRRMMSQLCCELSGRNSCNLQLAG
jgi:hypothetical protein